jgi:hypothetical protein
MNTHKFTKENKNKEGEIVSEILVNNEYSPPPQIREKIKTMVVYY